jgi:hypothetical protein
LPFIKRQRELTGIREVLESFREKNAVKETPTDMRQVAPLLRQMNSRRFAISFVYFVPAIAGTERRVPSILASLNIDRLPLRPTAAALTCW